MLKVKIIRNFSIVFLCLIIIQILRIYPVNKNVKTEHQVSKGVIYMLDDNMFLSRLDITYAATNNEDIIKEIIDILTINKDRQNIREGFSPIIPEDTKLLNLEIIGDNATLDFSKNFLDVDEETEEKLIEAIVYSITALKEINTVTIKVENILLQKLPHSLKKVPSLLDRTFKINKIYDLDSLDGVTSTTVYFPALKNGLKYYIPVTKYTNSEKEKIEIIIDELESSNTYNSNIVNYMNSETKLINYELLDKSLFLFFYESIFGDIISQNIVEEVVYSINLSIKDSYQGIETVMYSVKDNIINTHFLLLG